MAAGNGNPAKADEPKETKAAKPASYVLYNKDNEGNLKRVTSVTAVGREGAVQEAVREDKQLADVPLIAIAESRLVALKGAPDTRVKVTAA